MTLLSSHLVLPLLSSVPVCDLPSAVEENLNFAAVFSSTGSINSHFFPCEGSSGVVAAMRKPHSRSEGRERDKEI
ncbi:hypothetical protein F5878DRAFT_417353 [Lentinula raphanica]|uniref:Secreted protein n=1 Tax=Lentinula raphanica TaxID=153919 RepID=A0AA38NZ16_9AGAR|nr:hypothetical protein F5878DRAFT_417353 [Lentinula raphanica]